MNDQTAGALSEALRGYREELARIRPSAQLDARIAEALIAHAQEAPRPAPKRRFAALEIAAMLAIVVIVGLGFYLQLRKGIDTENASELTVAPYQQSVVPPAQVYQWPVAATVFRVRASLGASGMMPAAVSGPPVRHFWVDVGVASDGSLRIMQVIPADGDF
jgi:hypothetical protein